jgi:copper chaperone
MLELKVEGMSCGHCVQSVTKAVQGVDPAAKVDVDLTSQRVTIDSAAETSLVKAAIEEAGYEVVGLTA